VAHPVRRLIRRLGRRRFLRLLAATAAGGLAGGGMARLLLPSDNRQGASVRAFGAKGDGEHDDTAALQRAIESGAARLVFPAGQYRLTAPLVARSGQCWQGDGAARSVLIADGPGTEKPFNLVNADPSGILQDLAVQDLGFRGNRGRQLVVSRSGQEGFLLHLRTALHNVALRRCRFEHGGDGHSGGGGVMLGPRPEVPGGQSVQDLLIEDCVFADNSNVPGLYIASATGSQEPAMGGGIRVVGNSFSGVVGSVKVQNAIYILGGSPHTVLRHVEISGNRFEFATLVDAAIELNWVEDFIIANNTVHFDAAIANSSGILLRDGSRHGVVQGNVLSSTSREPTLSGIVLLNFAHPQTIDAVIISDNIVQGMARAIAVDRGSRAITVQGNRLDGGDGGDMRRTGVRVVDASAVRVRDNVFSGLTKPLELGVGDRPQSVLRGLEIDRNRFERCGEDGQPLIRAILPPALQRLQVEDLLIRDNSFDRVSVGRAVLDPVIEGTP